MWLLAILIKTLLWYRKLANFIEKPRRICSWFKQDLVQTQLSGALLPHLEKVTSWSGWEEIYKDTIRRNENWRTQESTWLGTGVSGVLEGPFNHARWAKEAYDLVADALEEISASLKMETMCDIHRSWWELGHYVKMVHNGIEYGDILIAESYDLMQHLLGLLCRRHGWNLHRTQNWTATWSKSLRDILKRKDDEGQDGPIIDQASWTAGNKGTGKWIQPISAYPWCANAHHHWAVFLPVTSCLQRRTCTC